MNSIQPEYRLNAERHPRTVAPPLGPELTDRLREIAASHCEAEGGCHGADHADRVHATALLIGREMGADLRIISAAALLHDIGRREESESRGRICHAARGAEPPLHRQSSLSGRQPANVAGGTDPLRR